MTHDPGKEIGVFLKIEYNVVKSLLKRVSQDCILEGKEDLARQGVSVQEGALHRHGFYL